MKKLFYIIAAIFIAVSLYLNFNLIKAGNRVKVQKENYADILNFKKRFLDPNEWLGDEAEQQKLASANQITKKVERNEKKSWTYLWIIIGLHVLFLAFVFYSYSLYKNYLILGIIVSALCCLHVGLMYPMLEITALEKNLDIGQLPIKTTVMGFKVDLNVEQEFKGDMIFYYQSKSVLELVQVLFQQKNWLVGISILAFSILFPLFKIGGTILLLFSDKFKNSKLINWFVKHSGKWSMADVFVVAVFLAFLAFSNMQVGIQTESKVLFGLYFFLGYCILSIWSTAYLKAALERSEFHIENEDK